MLDYRESIEYSKQAALSYLRKMGNCENELFYKEGDNYFQKLKCIANYWKLFHDEIIEWNTNFPNTFYRSYPYNWSEIMTPIEFDAWCSIRAKGRMVLYPQYPVLNYHIDFANPVKKIGLELDGRNFHDEAKDKARDKTLAAHGWKIYRITGKEMHNTKFTKDNYDAYIDDEDNFIEDATNWILNTGYGVIEAIRVIHFDGGFYAPNEFCGEYFNGLCHRTLYNHSNY